MWLQMLHVRQSLIFSWHVKGVQAQTVANFYLAFEAQLTIIPVINKVHSDLPVFGLIACIIFPLDCDLAGNSILTFSPSDWFEKCWSRESGVTDWKGVWYSTRGMHQGELECYCDPQKVYNTERSVLFSDLIFFQISAKLGTNVENVLQAVVDRIPA